MDEFYYLVFDAEGPMYDALNVTMYFDLIHYEVYSLTVIEECHVNTTYKIYGSCSVRIPLSGDVTKLLLQVMPAKNTEIDWDFSAYIGVKCSARIWMYAVIASCMLIGIVGPFAFLYILCKFKKRGLPNQSLLHYFPLLILKTMVPLILQIIASYKYQHSI